jgi:hypothetical protein
MDDSDRFDSCKQIAGYLGKSERTVRRWHEDERLPVHRQYEAPYFSNAMTGTVH